MEKDRLVAFSDGVIAIVITIMVLEMKVPRDASPHALTAVEPEFLSYVLSFAYLSIVWNNHHHFFQLVRYVNGLVLWANMHLLFWLALIPFATGWMGQNDFPAIPTAAYGLVLLMASLAAYGLKLAAFHAQGGDSVLADTIGRDLKGKVSPVLYVAGILFAFFDTRIAGAIYLLVAMLWFIPDRRIERVIGRP
jgi:uncharacterized membrane protein